MCPGSSYTLFYQTITTPTVLPVGLCAYSLTKNNHISIHRAICFIVIYWEVFQSLPVPGLVYCGTVAVDYRITGCTIEFACRLRGVINSRPLRRFSKGELCAEGIRNYEQWSVIMISGHGLNLCSVHVCYYKSFSTVLNPEPVADLKSSASCQW